MSYILHRKYPHRGRGSFTFGRRHKSTIKTSQMLIDANDGEGVVYHTIPRKKNCLLKKSIIWGKQYPKIEIMPKNIKSFFILFYLFNI